MLEKETIRTIVGIIGNVISFGLFISPAPTFWKIFKAKSVMGFKPDPYVATLLNCMMWVFYGLPWVHPGSILVATINGTGFFIEIFYLLIFLIYSDTRKRKKILIFVAIEMVFMAIVVFVTLQFMHTHDKRSALVGTLCVIFCIGMYTSPLTVMRRVIKTKSVKYMPFYLSLANFLNGIIWTLYALLRFDPFVLIPNGLGALSGLVQLILYATYYKSTNWNQDDEHKPSEIEIISRA